MIATLAELDKVRRECRSLVTRRSLMSAGVAVVPLPGADVVADVGLLTTLIPKISERFELDHEQVEKLEPISLSRCSSSPPVSVITSSAGW